MKILQVCPYFYPYLAGQERYVFQLSKKIVESKNEVNVYTVNHCNLTKFEIIDGISIHRFNMLFAPLNNPISYQMIFIAKSLKEYDVIHVHNEHAFVSFVACALNRISKKPLILTCHGQLKFGSYLKDAFEKMYSRTIAKFIFNSATKIIALSEEDKMYIINLGITEEKIIVLPNAINNDYLDKFLIDRNSLDYLQLHGIQKNKKMVLFVGRLIPRKGVEYLIKSIPRVIAEYKDVQFVIIGEGEEKENIITLCNEFDISNEIVFLNNISDEDLFIYYQLADIFVLPSLSEGLPTTILEAMYFGTAVIATDIPGIKSHFQDIALLVAPKDEAELSFSLLKLLKNESLCQSLALNGLKHVTKYTWNEVSNSYLKIYQDVTN